MLPRLYDWLRRSLLRSKRRAAIDAGAGNQWLSGAFHEPRSRTFHVLRQRELAYRLYLPAGIRKTDQLPLLVMLHGCSQTALEFAEGTRMNVEAERHFCAVLYPEQSRKSNSQRCWNWFEPESLIGRGEAALIAHAVRHVMDQYPIDSARVYIAGLSAGGAMVAVLCATHEDLFAACAIHSGVMFHAATTSLQALQVMQRGASEPPNQIAQMVVNQRGPRSRLVPTLIIHGTSDLTVNPINARQIAEQTRSLAERLYTEKDALTLRDEQRLESGGRRYRQQDLTFGQTVMLRSVLIEGLGHAWSGGDPHHKFFDLAGPDASRLVLEFLLPHRLPAELIVGDETIRSTSAPHETPRPST
jgi:poly(hydroxyalkanoate) depolymerase family esterase